ncbi:DNA methylase [Staphylococcus phage vB_Sau-RP15]|nr:DNA methylase [Staphylococcus phage vB_Sau-RP15]
MELELNKIYNEDCLEGMKKIPDNSVDLIVTDPPYLINYKNQVEKK